jgi:hypothetical protein
MGLDLSVLLNAALGGTAAYSGGKRAGRKSKLEDAINQENLASQREYRKSQMEASAALAAERKDRVEHPERYRAESKTPEYEAYADFYDSLIQSGKTPTEADAEARRRFGKNQEHPYIDPIAVHKANRAYDVAHPLPSRARGSSDTGEDGSQKALVDRREFLQSRIAKYRDQGYSLDEATSRANDEYDASSHSTGMFRDTSASGTSTAAALARSIPTGGANAGTRGVKPTVTSSTEKHNPTDPNSPKRGAVRPATDEELDAAIDAVGADPAKVRAYLAKKNLTP